MVDRVFASEDRAGVVTLLEAECGAALPLWSPVSPEGLERIRLAAIKLSAGQLAELRRVVHSANTDWRDVLVAAGFGDDVRAHERWAREQADL
jgi:hypothetical protein